MRDFDVQTVEIEAPFDVAFRYIADPGTLPEWSHAFRSVTGGRATLATPRGTVDIGLEVRTSREAGTVDWTMTFPDGSVGRAFSRLVDLGGRTLYSFVLLAPPVPLERVEGALVEQSRTLRQELATLQRKLGRA
jgi:Polyketide cyclase / dehydrase and lipid transport